MILLYTEWLLVLSMMIVLPYWAEHLIELFLCGYRYFFHLILVHSLKAFTFSKLLYCFINDLYVGRAGSVLIQDLASQSGYTYWLLPRRWLSSSGL